MALSKGTATCKRLLPAFLRGATSKGRPAFTHISYDDFRIIRDNLIEKGSRTTSHRQVPCTVFIDPQLGRIGMTGKAARAQRRRVRIAKLSMSAGARPIETDETRGFMKAMVDKAIVDKKTKRILGAAVRGIEGGEIMSVMVVAMMGSCPTPYAHPTLAESLNN